MKFCYFDESGMGTEPILVMSGIIVDAQRMHVTKDLWADFLDTLSDVAKKPIKEFHSRKFYNGTGPWRTIDGATRANIITAIIKWLGQRKHKITFTAIQKDNYKSLYKKNNTLKDLHSLWCTAAMHCILSLQKHHQKEKKTKGHTVLIFDREVREEEKLSNLVHSSPNCIGSYCQLDEDDPVLDQIIDVPFFADSKTVLLIQIADLISYILRTYAEIEEGLMKERYSGEKIKMKKWIRQIDDLCLPASTRYPSKGRCETSQLFWNLAPQSLRSLS